MKTLQFTTMINAPRARVWDCMLSDASYRIWTAAFCEGSYYIGSWEQGATIRFLSPNGDGMVSVIAENRRHEYVAIKHLGGVHDGVDDTSREEVRRWAPAYETYALSEHGDMTELSVTMDCTDEFEDYMVKTWPKALSLLKALCEKSAG